MSVTLSRLERCWGKTVKPATTAERFHPAAYHMLDVGHVAQSLLAEMAPVRWQRMLASTFGVDMRSLETWVPYAIAMHDIGKISAAFQAQNADQAARLQAEGFPMHVNSPVHDVPHSVLSQAVLHPQTGSLQPMGHVKLARAISEVAGGHHGRFVPQDVMKQARVYLENEPAEWDGLRKIADAALRGALLRTDAWPDVDNISTAVMALTGLVVLCDWIGSDEHCFPAACEVGWADYVPLSRERAETALRRNGLLEPAMSVVAPDVAALFDDLGKPRPLQQVIDEIPAAMLQYPVLAIIEAPTGEGKTEAALALARRMAIVSGTDEMFYALPTMATSNQMFRRLRFHLHERLGLATEVKLVHGQAFLVEDELRAETPASDIASLRNGDDATEQDPLEWYSGKKRALMAPFGVGTVDQAELAALNAKHAALRMTALAGKVIIIDEVHAYDVYMTTVIAQLLSWLASMQTSVILLSATLPQARRAQLLGAYHGPAVASSAPISAYPAVLLAQHGDEPSATVTVWQPERPIAVWQPDRRIAQSALHYGDADAAAKARWLREAVRDGGCACWIANTVKRAQDIFEALEELRAAQEHDLKLDLLHAQLPLEDRQQREVELAAAYGRDGAETGKRPARGVVVGTQVLEQSLDLDFDVMVSDLAPIDLLLQRAGRLHRHDRRRPDNHAMPRLYVNYLEDDAGQLQITSDRTVYAKYIQCLTHRTLNKRAIITLPEDYRTLVEAVYGGQPPAPDDSLYSAWRELKADGDTAVAEAELRLLPRPHPRDSFATTAANKIRFEESDTRADWLVAKTRLGERTLNVIPLERRGGLACLPDGTTLPVDAEAPRALQLRLLRRQLRISREAAIAALEQHAAVHPTRLFQKSALLKDYVPLWLTNGTAELPHPRGTVLFALNSTFGLRITQERAHDDTD